MARTLSGICELLVTEGAFPTLLRCSMHLRHVHNKEPDGFEFLAAIIAVAGDCGSPWDRAGRGHVGGGGKLLLEPGEGLLLFVRGDGVRAVLNIVIEALVAADWGIKEVLAGFRHCSPYHWTFHGVIVTAANPPVCLKTGAVT